MDDKIQKLEARIEVMESLISQAQHNKYFALLIIINTIALFLVGVSLFMSISMFNQMNREDKALNAMLHQKFEGVEQVTIEEY